jgi:hypothetical protein
MAFFEDLFGPPNIFAPRDEAVLMALLRRLIGTPDVLELERTRNIKGLIRALTYSRWLDVSEMAGEALQRLRDARAVKPACAALRSRHALIRINAAQLLLVLEDPRAVGPLCTALKDSDDRVSGAAAEALGRIGDARAIEGLSELLMSKRLGAAEAEAEKALNAIRASTSDQALKERLQRVFSEYKARKQEEKKEWEESWEKEKKRKVEEDALKAQWEATDRFLEGLRSSRIACSKCRREYSSLAECHERHQSYDDHTTYWHTCTCGGDIVDGNGKACTRVEVH